MYEELCFIEWGEVNGKFKSSKDKSSRNVLVVFYRKLHMVIKDASFVVKYPKILVIIKIRHYKEMFVEPPIFIRYVVLTIVICTSILAIELFYRTQLCSFHKCFFEYLTLFLHLQVCGISLTIFKEFSTFCPCSFVDPLVKGTDNFWKILGLVDGFNESRRQIASGREKPQMSQ